MGTETRIDRARADGGEPVAHGGSDRDGDPIVSATCSLSVPDMDCSSCARKVEASVSGLDGVTDIDPRPTAGVLSVGYDPDRTTPEAIRERVAAAGYTVVDDEEPAASASVWTSGRAIRTWVGGLLLLVGVTLEWLLPASNPTLLRLFGADLGLDWLAYVVAAAVPGTTILRNGISSIRTRQLDIDLLMSAGILGAIAVNLPFEAATLAVLFSIAELLERYSMDRARGSLRELMALSPETATVRRDGEERVVPASAVAVGDRVLVRPGEKVPVDGVVREGESSLDESAITGESVPVDKGPGAEVYAGSITQAGYLEIEATAPAAESTIARVIDLVAAAEDDQTDTEQFVDRFAAVYTPIIVVAALLTMALPPVVLSASFTDWFVRGLTLLVIACPCAFVISTPVSVVSGLTSAARNGVLIKAGSHLEAMGSVEAVALDKTGTLTTGDLGVTDVIPLGGTSEDELLTRAAALERRSEHPIATAIVEHADERAESATAGDDVAIDDIAVATDDIAADADGDIAVADFEALTGEGVRGSLDGVTHYAGKPALLADHGFDLAHAHVETDGGVIDSDGDAVDPADGGAVGPDDGIAGSDGAVNASDADSDPLAAELAACEHGQHLDLLAETIPRLQNEGKTVVLVGSVGHESADSTPSGDTDRRLLGILAVADTVRPEAAWAIDRLRDGGIQRIVMLTGDNERTARAIGERVGVDEVRASLLPEAKVEAVRELREAHDGGVAMVGDGINDAPALATASVGIAMGAAGTDTALETADIALMADDLTRLPYLSSLSQRATGVIRQNIYSSLGVKLLLAIGAPLGYVSVLTAIVVGDMGMSLGVTGNAMRLAGIEPAEPDFESTSASAESGLTSAASTSTPTEAGSTPTETGSTS